mmetsp:Transcript_39463/g.98816  ORF Transcript_39463/g.98816 Transcript_39463/m.98816 type:complete len:107 (-) Transcript_39463:211-531(-)
MGKKRKEGFYDTTKDWRNPYIDYLPGQRLPKRLRWIWPLITISLPPTILLLGPAFVQAGFQSRAERRKEIRLMREELEREGLSAEQREGDAGIKSGVSLHINTFIR